MNYIQFSGRVAVMPSGERTKFCLQKTHLQKHGKVADKKSRACVQRYQRRLLIREATRLMKTITLKSNVITALEGPSHLSPGVATKEKKLSELTQQINEARAEHATLLERKNELLSDTTLHKGFLETIKHNVSKLEDQVKRNGQTLHSQRIGETRLNTENHDEIVRLQNQIKIRTKLNCLQSDKIVELEAQKEAMNGKELH